MAGLQDLLLVRQLQDQNDPFKVLAANVAKGIETGRAEQKAKKSLADKNAATYNLINRLNTDGDKTNDVITRTTIKDGVATVIGTTETPSQRALRNKAEIETKLLRDQDNTIEEFFADDSELTQIDLLKSNVPPSDVVKMDTARNRDRLQKSQKIQNSLGDVAIQQDGQTVIRGGERTGTLIPKSFDVEKNIPSDIVDIEGIKDVGAVKAQIKGEETGVVKWSSEAAQREIKFNVATPKLNYFMDVGGRAYKELKREAKDKLGVEMDFTTGGTNFYKNLLIKKGLQAGKFIPLMTALDRLRPELGVELMRQLGAFRSAQMAKTFENTLAQFSGNIKEDIANMTTTIAKNAANTELIDDNGNILPDSVRDKKMVEAEANLIRRYNYMYRNMGLIDKPYLAERSFDWVAENSNFTQGEEDIISNAMADNPGYSRINVSSKLIEQGLL